MSLASIEMRLAALAFIATALVGFIQAQAPMGSKDLFRCRQSCYQKFVQDWHHCMDFEDCKNMCITPPNINSYIPEAFSFLCWNNCDQQLGPFPLNINSAMRQGSLVLTDIAWDQAITNASKQCLVTWEVSGGGLMGNLLTDSSTVELSLWPDTVYHVQVTCKHKETGGMRRSYKLIVDTHKLSDSAATGVQTIEMPTGLGPGLPNIYGNALANSNSNSNSDGNNNNNGEPEHGLSSAESELDSRMRILKDSSKDFLTPYNPNAKVSAPAAPASTTDSAPSRDSSVLRSKLSAGIGEPNTESSVRFINQTILLAVLIAMSLFFGLLAIYALTRPARKELHLDGATAIDKEVLIRTEMLPSPTPSAHLMRPAAGVPIHGHAHAPARLNGKAAAAVAASPATPAAMMMPPAERRTLHV